MKFYNRIDEQGRFMSYFVTNEPDGQTDTHSMSYLAVRKIYQECGDKMGLEKK